MKQGWGIKKLGEVCDILNGYAFKSKKYTSEGVRVLRITNVQKGYVVDDDPKFYPKDEMANLQQYILKENDLLMSLTGNVGRVGLLQNEMLPAALNQRVACLRIKNEQLNINYLFHFLNSDKFENDAIFSASGIAQKNMSTEWLKKYTIPVPPREEQERIVAELDCLSGVIEKKREQLRELDVLAQSIFYQMFGDPITNEKGWDVKKVIDVVKMQRGFDLPVQDRDNEGTIPIYGSNGIIGYHTIHKANFGIITGRSGTLGEVYSSNEPFWPLNTTLFSVDTHGNNVIFLKYIMANFHLERFKAGAGVPTLNRNEFHNEPIPNIPLTLQQEFADKIEAIEKQKELIKQSITQTEELFNSRMDYYFN